MPCPECKAEDRLCVHNGNIYRKKAITPGNTMGAKVKRYLCQSCGYTGRGKFFGLPEFDVEEAKFGEE
jgi:hypothetical protein